MRFATVLGLSFAAASALYFTADWSQSNGIVSFYRETLPAPLFFCWLVGLAAATVSPPACAVLFWILSRRWRRGWILHLLIVPATYGVVQVCSRLMLWAAGEPDTGSLSGRALLPALLGFLVCPVLYLIVLGADQVRRRAHFDEPR